MKRRKKEDEKQSGKKVIKMIVQCLVLNKKVLRFHWFKAYIVRKYFPLFHLTLPGSYYGFVHVIYTSFLTTGQIHIPLL